jgi:hypothetical protein
VCCGASHVAKPTGGSYNCDLGNDRREPYGSLQKYRLRRHLQLHSYPNIYLYSQALESLQAGTDLTPAAIYVCGHTHVGAAPDKGPVCGAPKTKFKEVR